MKTIENYFLGLSYVLCGIAVIFYFTYPGMVHLLSALVAIVLLLVAGAGSIYLLYQCSVTPFNTLRFKIIFTVIGLTFFLIILLNAQTFADYPFNSRRASMERFLSTVPVTNGWLSSAKGEIKVPAELADYVRFVDVNRSSSNHIQAVFDFWGGSALRHIFWYYDSQGDPPDARGYRRLDTCWYVASG